MVASPGNEPQPRPDAPHEPHEPHGPHEDGPARRRGGTARRRRRPRRESALLWWALFAFWAAAAWYLRSWPVALLGLLVWCLYEFMLVPTFCRTMTRKGSSCREPVRGRLFACEDEHQRLKIDGLWRLVGMRNPLRGPDQPPAERESGQVVVSPEVRGRLSQIDRMLILLAAAGTLVTIVGMVYGYV
ncbi:hypothetical protein [Spirillospora sp. NPDC029432]|uniref:hypothetical protein n=1 Tax=Spirillospora sp. NPDC029432 TaxID=3154599 RepID=UPI0034524089